MSEAFSTMLYLVFAWFAPIHNLRIIFLKNEVQFLKNNLKRHGIEYPVLEPAEKQELLRIGAQLGPQVEDIFLINSWSTYCRWLSIERNGGKLKKPGRLRTISQSVRDLIVSLARENIEWGIVRITGEIKKLVEKVCANSVKRILKLNGIEPIPGKGKRISNGNWKKFIDAHMDTTVAVDFFTSKLAT